VAPFQRATEIDPKNGPALLNLGRAQRTLEHYDQAEKTFRQLSALPDKEYRPIHAVYLFGRGQREEAIKEFEQLAKADPKDPQAAVRLIRAYLEVKRFPEAEQAMEVVLKKNPKQTEVLVERGQLRLATGHVQEAVQDLTQALHFEPGLAGAHFLLSKAHQFRGDEAARRQELGEALKTDPFYLRARIDLAESLIASKGAAAALEYLNQAPQAQQRFPALIVSRNWALLAIGDKAALRKSIDEGLEIQKTPELLLQDGYLRIQNKDFAGARASLQKALELSPEEVRALDAVSKTYLAEKKPALALGFVQDYVSKYPKSAPLQFLLGEWLLEFKKNAEARTAFGVALQAAPGFLGAELKLADLDIADGNLDSARQRLGKVVATPAGKVSAELRLGLIEERPEGNAEAAIGHYRKVLELDPKNLTALNNLAYHLANDTQQFDEALKVAQQAKEIAPKDPTVDDTIGWAYYNKGLYDTAVKYFEASVATQPNARRQYHLAMAYFKAGSRLRALAVLTAARKMDPTLPEAEVAGQLLADKGKVKN
jgi:tetratricopeptide (TPR) repeat protein